MQTWNKFSNSTLAIQVIYPHDWKLATYTGDPFKWEISNMYRYTTTTLKPTVVSLSPANNSAFLFEISVFNLPPELRPIDRFRNSLDFRSLPWAYEPSNDTTIAGIPSHMETLHDYAFGDQPVYQHLSIYYFVHGDKGYRFKEGVNRAFSNEAEGYYITLYEPTSNRILE